MQVCHGVKKEECSTEAKGGKEQWLGGVETNVDAVDEAEILQVMMVYENQVRAEREEKANIDRRELEAMTKGGIYWSMSFGSLL